MLNPDLSQQAQKLKLTKLEVSKITFFYPIFVLENRLSTFAKNRPNQGFSQTLPPDMKAKRWFSQNEFCVPMANCRSVFMLLIHNVV